MTNSQTKNGQRQGRVINPTLADYGRLRIQYSWIDLFNKAGKAMISAPDVYSAQDSILSSLREDLKKDRLVTSTRISCNENDLGAKIIQDVGSTVVKPTEKSIVVPVYSNKRIAKAAKTKNGLKYLQALFNTEDKASKLIGRLEEISEKGAEDIRIWTPYQEQKLLRSEMAVLFSLNYGQFNIFSNIWADSSPGYSLGVSVKSEEKQ